VAREGAHGDGTYERVTQGQVNVNVNVNELRLGFSKTTRNPEGILSHINRKVGLGERGGASAVRGAGDARSTRIDSE
jgi:hypothetical protein